MSQMMSRSLKLLTVLGALLAVPVGSALAAPARTDRAAWATTHPGHDAMPVRASMTRVASARIAHDAGVLGDHVIVFTPSMPQSQIQSELTAIGNEQFPQSSQFDSDRYAIFFEPGTYGSAADPLTFQVGYYEQVAGLGAAPGDVVINGAAEVNNQCVTNADGSVSCNGLDNFWRSLSNLTLNFSPSPTAPDFAANAPETSGCEDSNEMWAASQASPIRRVVMNATTFLFDYCDGNQNAFVSGGFFGDDTFSGQVINGGQQQYFTRNTNLDGSWSNGVWNQVFLGDNGAPPTTFPGGNQYTTLPTTPVSEEPPFLETDPSGNLQVFVPSPRANSVGPDYTAGPAAGASEPISRFFVADPRTPVDAINAELARGRDLILTPGVYHLDRTIEVRRPDTIVLGLGFATLIPDHGQVTMQTANVPGVKLSGLIFDAGPLNSRALLIVGARPSGNRGWGGHAQTASDPTLVSDVFFRIGGAEAGRARDALVVNTDDTILDDIWAWRADHGAGAGWTTNPSDTGLVVNGDDVKAYGLAVEHFQKNEVEWNGQHGEDVFFQNEMPYDPPSQAAWMSSATTDGYPSFKLANWVTSFAGWGMGSYSNFTNNVFSDEAFASPTAPGVQWHDLLTVFLNGQGAIRSVIDGQGGEADKATSGVPQDVVSFP